MERRKRQRYRLNKILGDGETACLIRVEFVCVCVCACVRACVCVYIVERYLFHKVKKIHTRGLV